MSVLDLFNLTVKVIPGKHNTSNRQTKFQNDDADAIHNVPAKLDKDKLGDKFFMCIDSPIYIHPGFIIMDEGNLDEYVVEESLPKPSSICPMYYRVRLRLSHLGGVKNDTV
jgi:hypothetical protein